MPLFLGSFTLNGIEENSALYYIVPKKQRRRSFILELRLCFLGRDFTNFGASFSFWNIVKRVWKQADCLTFSELQSLVRIFYQNYDHIPLLYLSEWRGFLPLWDLFTSGYTSINSSGINITGVFKSKMTLISSQ